MMIPLSLAALLLAAPLAAADFTIVVDAGSTGTRVYKVSEPGCVPKIELLAKGKALASAEDSALADLLGAVAARLGDAEIRVIGTGGFRKLDSGPAQTCGGACALKKKAVSDATQALFPNAKVHVATGEEEGRLSRLSVAALTGDAAVATVEIGGATVQVATPSDSRGAAIGVKSLMPKLPYCTAKHADFAVCRAQASVILLEDAEAQRLLQTDVAGGQVVGVGGAFSNLAKMLDLRPGDDLSTKLGEIEALGERSCPEGDGFAAPFKDQACTQLALASILIERFHIQRIEDVSLELGAALEDDAELGPSALAAACPLR